MVISELLGVPDDRREEVRHAIDGTFHIEPGVGMINDKALTARIELWQHIERIIEERRAEPRDDLISALLAAEVTDDDGTTRRLDDEECN
jgi:cytochrome P450